MSPLVVTESARILAGLRTKKGVLAATKLSSVNLRKFHVKNEKIININTFLH